MRRIDWMIWSYIWLAKVALIVALICLGCNGPDSADRLGIAVHNLSEWLKANHRGAALSYQIDVHTRSPDGYAKVSLKIGEKHTVIWCGADFGRYGCRANKGKEDE